MPFTEDTPHHSTEDGEDGEDMFLRHQPETSTWQNRRCSKSPTEGLAKKTFQKNLHSKCLSTLAYREG